jgi:UDP-glucuronate 4-epimerase
MRSLVTGCAGFIGSHLTEALLADGQEVLGVDCFNDNYARREKLGNLHSAQSYDSFEFVPLDLARGDLRDLVERVDVIYHLAAEPGIRASWGERFEIYLRNNVLATHHLLEAARSWPGVRFVFASSSSIYGQAERFPTTEDEVPRPFSPYGVTKLSAEHLCRAYGANFDLPVTCLRYFSVYGPRQRPDMAFTRFCHAALERQPITVFGDGRQTRDFTFVADIVKATRLASERPLAVGGVFNVGGGSAVSLNEALATLGTIAGVPLDVRYLDPERGDVRDTGADTQRARAELGYEPSTSLTDGLAAQFAWAHELALER